MTWELTDHACARCFGRVLQETANGASLPKYRCAECGHIGAGTVQSICTCGVKVGSGSGLECLRNVTPRPELPQEVLVRQRQGGEKQARDRNVPARVEIGGDRGFLN